MSALKAKKGDEYVISIQYVEAIVSVSLYTSTGPFFIIIMFLLLLLWTSSTGFESSFRGTTQAICAFVCVYVCVCVCLPHRLCLFTILSMHSQHTLYLSLTHFFSLLHLSITMLLASEWWLHSSSSSLSSLSPLCTQITLKKRARVMCWETKYHFTALLMLDKRAWIIMLTVLCEVYSDNIS